jgi:superfamily II DNA/RNA helicase
MLDKERVSLSRVRFMCFDEADKMLDMGFEKVVTHSHTLPLATLAPANTPLDNSC